MSAIQLSRLAAGSAGNISIQIVSDDSDPFCDPNNPKVITFADVTAAAWKIKDGIAYTPCTRSNISDELSMEVYVKKDFLQATGSFKERGARYALLRLSEEQKKKGVISASCGNHAQAISYHGYKLSIPVTVVMPVVAPIMKIQTCQKYNAKVILEGNNISESRSFGLIVAKKEGLVYINGYDHPDILAGQGTLGLEILEQIPEPDAIVIPVGGGGLIAGVAKAVKHLRPCTKIIGVEAENCMSMTKSLEQGAVTYTATTPSLADGLAVPVVGYNAFATAAPLIDKMVTVKEEWIALAMLRLTEIDKCIVEGSGATPLAAILAGLLNEFARKKIVLILSGANVDTSLLGRCLERGLAADNRLVRFQITLSDRPGGFANLCKLLASLGVSIKRVIQERAWLKDVFSVNVKILCETRDKEHSLELCKALTDNYIYLPLSDQ